MSTRRPPSSSRDYEQLLVDHLAVVDRVVRYVARRHHLSPQDTEELASHARLKLVEDDYAILRKFEGRSRLDTYLTIVVQRMFLDLRVAEWGKWRPSAAAKRLGGGAVELERLVIRDGLALEEAVNTLVARGGDQTREQLLEAWSRLPSRALRRFAGEEELALVAAEGGRADQGLDEQDDRQLAERVGRALARAMEGLPAQDQLVLKLRFVDGVSVAQASRMLGIDQKGLYRRLDQVQKALRAGLEAEGIDRESIDRITGHPLVAIGDVLGVEPPEEVPETRPSNSLRRR
ncbi:MAG: sigma-70 family RNA polymerase sigma factor [Vicinamibacterales bacterium]